MQNFKSWPVPKGISVSLHAGEQYLARIMGLPYDDLSLCWAARHVLALNLEGRVWPIQDSFAQSGIFRLKLAGPGVKFIYQPDERRIVTVIPGIGESFGLTVPVPADFLVDERTLELLRVSWDRLTAKRWPVTGGGRNWLGIRVDKRNAVLNLLERTVVWPAGGQGRPPLTAVLACRKVAAGERIKAHL